MNVYVSCDRKAIREFHTIRMICEKIGVGIMFDWTMYDIAADEKLKEKVEKSIEGIEGCDVFVILYNGEVTGDMMFEYGCAVALRKEIVFVNLTNDLKSDLIKSDYMRLIRDEDYLGFIKELEGFLKGIKKCFGNGCDDCGDEEMAGCE